MSFKRICLSIVILSVVFFTLISLLSIWDIIEDEDFIWKSLTSLGVVGFAVLVGVAISEKINKNQSQ